MVSSEDNKRAEETHWLEQAWHGDADSFMHLIELYQNPVFNLCYRMLGNREDAEDAAQETFLRAYHHLKKYDFQRSFATWLLSIAAHHCIDQLRKNRINLVSLEDLVLGDISDPLPTPERRVVQRDEQQNVQNILLKLSELDRAAIIFYYWYDMSYVEISEILHLSVSSIKSRLHRARKEMACLWLEQSNAPGSKLERKRYETPVV